MCVGSARPRGPHRLGGADSTGPQSAAQPGPAPAHGCGVRCAAGPARAGRGALPLCACVRSQIQEKSACLAMGALPASVPLVLQDELVDKLQCGGGCRGVGGVRWRCDGRQGDGCSRGMRWPEGEGGAQRLHCPDASQRSCAAVCCRCSAPASTDRGPLRPAPRPQMTWRWWAWWRRGGSRWCPGRGARPSWWWWPTTSR